MDGENNRKPYENEMIGGYHYFRKHPYKSLSLLVQTKPTFDQFTRKLFPLLHIIRFPCSWFPGTIIRAPGVHSDVEVEK